MCAEVSDNPGLTANVTPFSEDFSLAAEASNPAPAQAFSSQRSAETHLFPLAAPASNPSPRKSAAAPKERHSSLKIEVPGGALRVLLHVCCAPCCGAIVECLQENGIEPVIFFSNSNIYPLSEYEHRRAECERWAAARGVVFVEDEYDHAAWREAVLGLEYEPERGRRCSECFRFRLLRAAQYAATHGLTVLTTSLASSRWKNLDQVNAAGEAAVVETVEIPPIRTSSANLELDASAAGQALLWWPQNWRKGGLQERRGQIIREQNFYNQLYCGCEFSMATSPAIARQSQAKESD